MQSYCKTQLQKELNIVVLLKEVVTEETHRQGADESGAASSGEK